ncbi:sulfotransferase 1C2-like [Anneissia japonica]|uniref:sulfotransferase 1C2-like n=1 Tax=Anneissia japonica TaxID=1529436 RepID=UPI0014257EB6|nr:sulfotransferase 1C2-like [Anneissia japonica]XP_033126752.1 sulfotransferase 1C2-like [Anneissia japonica]XP_033126753.1 sulfotransferase 1C2-like [Anneissia japonica]
METITWFDKESGFTLDYSTPKEILEVMKTFKVRDDDVWVVTYPKSGTTWMQEIVSAVCADGDLESIKQTSLDDRVPFIDCVFSFDKRPRYMDLDEKTSRRLIKTHFPHQLIPPGVLKQTPKVIYVSRNPKDVIVSCFHFYNAFVLTAPKIKWDDFFQYFIKNEVPWGSWFDHNLYWWNRRHESHVMFVKFEEMKQDLTKIVRNVCEFLGRDLNEETISRITDHCSFSSMKTNPQTNKSDLMAKTADSSTGNKFAFMRKGNVGDWKNHFTVTQNEQFNKLYKEKLDGTDLTFDFVL